MTGREESWTNEADDAAKEAAVIRHLLDIHPSRLNTAELIREICGDDPGFAERDAIERAVRELAALGLIHRGEELLTPTRAALRLSRLLDG
jgi:hypothetical protein